MPCLAFIISSLIKDNNKSKIWTLRNPTSAVWYVTSFIFFAFIFWNCNNRQFHLPNADHIQYSNDRCQTTPRRVIHDAIHEISFQSSTEMHFPHLVFDEGTIIGTSCNYLKPNKCHHRLSLEKFCLVCIVWKSRASTHQINHLKRITLKDLLIDSVGHISCCKQSQILKSLHHQQITILPWFPQSLEDLQQVIITFTAQLTLMKNPFHSIKVRLDDLFEKVLDTHDQSSHFLLLYSYLQIWIIFIFPLWEPFV